MFGGRRQLLTAASTAALATALLIPNAASAGPLDDLLDRVSGAVEGLTGGGNGGVDGAQQGPEPAGTAPAASAPAGTPVPLQGTEPPLDGTGPHAQGTVLDIDADTPLTPGTDDVVIGRSRGEQDDAGDYHGQVTIVSAVGLEVSVSTDEDETQQSPLQAVNDLLNQVCTGTGNNVCLAALEFNSTTADDGSSNSFSALRAQVGNGLVTTGVIQSNGDISDDGECQTASAGSSAADVGAVNGLVDVAALQSTSESVACNDGSETTTATSSVADLSGTGVLTLLGCNENTVDDEFGIALLLEGVCNADDTNAGQTDPPYNVRQAINLEILPGLAGLAGGLINLNGGSSESHAVAPGEECPDPTNPACPPQCPDPTNPDCPPPDECPDPTNPDCPDDDDGDEEDDGREGAAPGGPIEGPGDEALPFTGADMLTLLLVGGSVMGAGLLLMAVADRRRRAESDS